MERRLAMLSGRKKTSNLAPFPQTALIYLKGRKLMLDNGKINLELISNGQFGDSPSLHYRIGPTCTSTETESVAPATCNMSCGKCMHTHGLTPTRSRRKLLESPNPKCRLHPWQHSSANTLWLQRRASPSKFKLEKMANSTFHSTFQALLSISSYVGHSPRRWRWRRLSS